MKALVFAAGLGTRLGSITRDMPKALVPVGGQAMLGRVMQKLCFAGFRDIVVTACYKSWMVEDWLRENTPSGAAVALSLEPGPDPFETGGGIKFARPLLGDEPFLVHNVDILSDADLAAFAEAAVDSLASDPVRGSAAHPSQPGGWAPPSNDAEGGTPLGGEAAHSATDNWPLAALLVTAPRPEDYRFFLFDPADMRLRGWTNTRTGEVRGCVRGAEGAPANAPAASGLRRMSFCGIHVVSPAVFPLMESWPERFSITDFYIKEAERHPIYGIAAPNLKIIDIGTPETLAAAETLLKQAGG